MVIHSFPADAVSAAQIERKAAEAAALYKESKHEKRTEEKGNAGSGQKKKAGEKKDKA